VTMAADAQRHDGRVLRWPSRNATGLESNMLAIARVVVVLCVLTGCGLPMPANSGPCQVAPGSQECQIWMYSRAQ